MKTGFRVKTIDKEKEEGTLVQIKKYEDGTIGFGVVFDKDIQEKNRWYSIDEIENVRKK